MGSRPQELAPLALLLLGSCISGGYSRQQLFSPISHARVHALEPGKTTLSEALSDFGAPLFVWEWQGDGAALAWGWGDAAHWGFSVSVPVGNYSATAYSYDDLANVLPGAVLFFGPDDVLIEAREGKLADIRAETIVKRPAPPPEALP